MALARTFKASSRLITSPASIVGTILFSFVGTTLHYASIVLAMPQPSSGMDLKKARCHLVSDIEINITCMAEIK